MKSGSLSSCTILNLDFRNQFRNLSGKVGSFIFSLNYETAVIEVVIGGVVGLRQGALETQRVLIACFGRCCHRVHEIVRDIKVVQVAKNLQKAALVRANTSTIPLQLLLLEESIDLTSKSSLCVVVLLFGFAEAGAIVATCCFIASYGTCPIIVILLLLTVIELGLSALNFKFAV